jgi:xanthine dehydrogenase accessory factor
MGGDAEVMPRRLARRAEALATERTPFVTALVVRVERPTSVSAGDAAILLADGTVEGFVGGQCAESTVRLHAARVMETGEPLLLRIVPGDGEEPAVEGTVTVHNPCLSGGSIEIFLEPRLPAPRVVVVGDTPIAFALQSLGEGVGYDVTLASEGVEEREPGDAAVVVASHGRHEEPALAKALADEVPYVGLVASRRRGASVVEALRGTGVPEEQLRRLRTPAGLDIGAVRPEEIALAILAEIVKEERARHHLGPAMPATATDPVCGMTVEACDASPHLDYDSRRLFFCSEGCLRAFEEDPARHVARA